MGIFSGFWGSNTPEKRSASGSLKEPDERLLSTFGLVDHAGQVRVSQETVLALATAYRCADLLSSSVASLPWELFRKLVGGGVEHAVDHPVYKLLKRRPHRLYGSFHFRKTLFLHALLWGNGYAYIERNGWGRPISLEIYHPRDVTVSEGRDNSGKRYLFYHFHGMKEAVSADDVLHLKLFSLDGLMGRSVIRQAADASSIKLGLQAARFAHSIMENGGRPSGIVMTAKKLGAEAVARIKRKWFNNHGGGKAGTAVLDDDMKYQAVQINPVDAQLLEMMKLSREDICALFGVPPHLAMILDKATYSNIEQQDLEFVKHFLMPHVINFQEEADYKLLREQEQDIYCTKINVNALVRGDMNTRKEYYRTMRTLGIMSANEIRALEDMSPYEGGDKYLVQGAMVAIDENGMPQLQTKNGPKPPPNSPN